MLGALSPCASLRSSECRRCNDKITGRIITGAEAAELGLANHACATPELVFAKVCETVFRLSWSCGGGGEMRWRLGRANNTLGRDGRGLAI
jgi:hypothetical protein